MDIGNGGKSAWWNGPRESKRPDLVLLGMAARKLSTTGFAPKKLTDDEKGAITHAFKLYYDDKCTIASFDRQGLLAKINEVIGFNNPIQRGVSIKAPPVILTDFEPLRVWHAIAPETLTKEPRIERPNKAPRYREAADSN